MTFTPKRILLAILLRTLGETRTKAFFAEFKRLFSPDKGYPEEYFAAIDADHYEAYQLLAKTIATVFTPQKVTDVGCGSGGLSRALMDLNIQVDAFDFSSASLALAHRKGVTQARQLDLVEASVIDSLSDVCICLEVAEHLPARSAPKLARLLSAVAPVVIFTAAPPGQGGHFHINEQPQEYWIHLFQNTGMTYSSKHVENFRNLYQGRMLKDYDQNLMIFTRNP